MSLPDMTPYYRDAEAGISAAQEYIDEVNASMVPLAKENLRYWLAWGELGSDRPAVMDGVAPIPYRTIYTYCVDMEMDATTRDRYRAIIRALDRRYLQLIKEKEAKRAPKG